MTAIEVKELNKTFSHSLFEKKNKVLNGLSFEVNTSTITGFLGANGAGKTTTFKILLGAIYADSGEFQILGKDLSKSLKESIGFMPEKPLFPEHLNAKEFLNYHASFYKQKNLSKTRAEEVLELVGLKDVGKKKIKDFSKGMMQRLGIGQAVLHKPKLILLDEPMSGLDPLGRFDLARIIEGIANEGVSVFLSSHLLDDVQKLCKEVVVMDQGRAIFQGEIGQMLSRSKAKYRLVFEKKGKHYNEEMEDSDKAKARLQDLLGEGATIIEFVRQESLEEAFMEMNRAPRD